MSVTVATQKGDIVEGTFKGASADAIMLEVAGQIPKSALRN